MVLDEPVTVTSGARPPGPGGGQPRRSAARGAALVALAVVVLEAAAGFLPAGPLVWVVTPLRLIVGLGVVALAVGGLSLVGLWRSPLAPAAMALVVAAALATVVSGQDWSGWRGVLTQVAVFTFAAASRRAWPESPAPFGLLALVAVAMPAGVAVAQSVNRTPTGFCRGAANALADVCGPHALV